MKSKTSPVWNYFVDIDNSTAKCKICNKIYSRKGRTTTALKSHLKSLHVEIFAEFQKLDADAKSSLEAKKQKVPKDVAATMPSEEQFSLCWNNFQANMSAGFHDLLSRGDLVDVTLAAEGRLLQAHKLVLSVCSPYFQEMFKMNPTQHPIVFLKDVSHSALRDLLQFMYQGEVNVKQDELASFISTAEQLQVKGLTGNQKEESSTPSKPKPTLRPNPRSSQQRQSFMTKLEIDLDSKPSSTPVAVKRTNKSSIASNNSSFSQSGPAKRKCVDPLEAGPSGSAKEEFVTIPDEDENNAVAPKMEPEFVNESMWDEDEDGTNNDETNFGEDDSNMEMTGFDDSATGDEGGAVARFATSWSSEKS